MHAGLLFTIRFIKPGRRCEAKQPLVLFCIFPGYFPGIIEYAIAVHTFDQGLVIQHAGK